MILLILLAQISPAGDKNVALDDERLQDNVPKGLQKVELDLDDALFLEFEEKEEEAETTPVESLPEPEEAAPPSEQLETPAKKNRKKLWIFGIAAGLCLLLGAGGSYFFMKSDPPAPGEQTSTEAESTQEPQTPQDSALPADADSPEKAQTQKPEEIQAYSLEQFQIEYNLEGKIRFLTCRFSIPDTTPVMRAEIQAKRVLIRDGIYRYLKNSPLFFMDNPQESEKLKTDITTVINQTVKSGHVSEILLEEYVVK
ncbi:flagellar basal body-associated FliL family protein [Desulfomicrobium baculatum]|uniref:Flagellar protein FliL n=1 Tax=Desulfomicrobium baculatum (strain DSM 4028 / VKM B-1378 / X) TaxID=525897 RepID=C7LQN2_DESBD|nr:flagellar basal body-associated FliL family protein [Desulfomicrobium baculatum]ACU91538.1 flagellar basal body-associated protein FliL [Desulfomicrobium baculatum DSM 4028]